MTTEEIEELSRQASKVDRILAKYNTQYNNLPVSPIIKARFVDNPADTYIRKWVK